MSNTGASQPDAGPAFFLPDFCGSRAVLAVVLIVELVALVFAIARQALHDNFWTDLATTSLFLLWVGLTCTAVLCRARTWLHSLSTSRAVTVMLVLLVTTIGLVSEVAYQIGQLWGIDAASGSQVSIFPRDHAGFLLRNIAVGFIVSALALRYFYVNAQRQRSIEMEALARIHALQARIRPHFLFNSMNTIASLTRSNPERAEQAVEDPADLFRASLNDATVRISLEDEIEIARTHQRIEQLRLGDRLQVQWDIADLPLNARVPSLIIQPLLENAVYHGIEMLPQGGCISIRGARHGDTLEIEVRNPVPAQTGYGEREGNRMALENIRQRLELAWPGRARVETEQKDGEFCARLIFPYADSPLLEGSSLDS